MAVKNFNFKNKIQDNGQPPYADSRHLENGKIMTSYHDTKRVSPEHRLAAILDF